MECVLQTESKKEESEISMSNMKQLLESVTKFAGEPKQKPGDQVRGHEKAKSNKNGKHPFAGRLVGGSANESQELEESLMTEYKYFVQEQTPPAANATPTASSPVANINPAGTGTAATQPATGTAPAATGTPPATNTATTAKPPTTGQAPAGQQPPKPGQPAAPAGQQPPAGQAAAKPAAGAPGAGTATPPNPQQVKQATDAVTKIMNNPADPFNAQLQALLKKAGMVPR
jgi:hypothetical protein